MFAAEQAQATGRALMRLDDRAHRLSEAVAGTPPVKALDWFSKLGDQPEIRLLAGAMMMGGVFASNDRLTHAGSRMMIAHEAATFAKDLIKSEIDRKRPRSARSRAEKKPRTGDHQAKEMTSFPSGHSAGAIAAARAFAREYPEYGAAALGVAAVIAASQVPRRAHYPTDILAGVAVGLVAEALVNLGWRAAQAWGTAND